MIPFSTREKGTILFIVAYHALGTIDRNTYHSVPRYVVDAQKGPIEIYLFNKSREKAAHHELAEGDVQLSLHVPFPFTILTNSWAMMRSVCSDGWSESYHM